MKKNLDWHQAIATRTSRRAYTGQPLTSPQKQALADCLTQINAEGTVKFVDLPNASQFLNGFRRSYGMFKNATSCIALTGKKSTPHIEMLVGYYGEFLVLMLENLKVGTCWTGGTYDRKEVAKSLDLNDDEELFLVIVYGQVEKEKTFKEKLVSQLGKNKPSWEELLLEAATVPDWAKAGLEAARLAPSAVNKKPTRYQWDGKQMEAFAYKKNGYEQTDLGISMAHFELGALKAGVTGSWEPSAKGYAFKRL